MRGLVICDPRLFFCGLLQIPILDVAFIRLLLLDLKSNHCFSLDHMFDGAWCVYEILKLMYYGTKLDARLCSEHSNHLGMIDVS
jgi:hypothetical protein